MNKELLSFLSILIALFVGALYYSNIIQNPMVSTLNFIKSSYHNTTQSIQNGIDKYFFQASHIDKLKDELQMYENNHIVMHQIATQIHDLYLENGSSFSIDPRVSLVRTISYAKFGDFNKVWIDMEDFNSSRIYGLTYKELVAGIVVNDNGKPLALLNRDIKSSYAVSIGDQEAPGIVHGNNAKNLVVKFIPTWIEVYEGDEVVTSGLDAIFFKGLKVGRVLSVSKSQGYQNAIIEPYYNANNPDYFHVIEKVQ
jgi:rod shape-determining protein MreC